MSSASRRSGHDQPVREFESSTLHSSGWNVAAACIEPLYNVLVSATEVVLTVDLPYVDHNLVKLSCPANDVVEIYAETNRKITFKDLGLKHRHGEFTCYHARIRIPVPVDENGISTQLKRGVLEIHIPRLK